MNESEILELKKSTSELKEAVISIVAILNKHKKGEVYFGIKDNGEIIGQDVSDKTLREVGHTISDNIEPKIFPKIENALIEDRQCIYVKFEGKEAPYYAYGRAYIRTGTENKQISARELENIIIDKNKESMRWDNQINEETTLKDIDEVFTVTFKRKELKAGEKVTEKINLNDRQKKAIEYIKEKGNITTKEYLILNLGIKERTARYDLNDLVERNILIKVGSTASAHYELKSSAKFGKVWQNGGKEV